MSRVLITVLCYLWANLAISELVGSIETRPLSPLPPPFTHPAPDIIAQIGKVRHGERQALLSISQPVKSRYVRSYSNKKKRS